MTTRRPGDGDDGFMLLTAIVMIFMVLLLLSIAAPRISREIQRDREQESAHRAQQYVRAVRIFYNKFHRYPGSIEQLEKTNNQRFLRQKYDDPLTGKPDWRLIHVGENQTKVKGFFGEDLPGLPGGLGAGFGSAPGPAPAPGPGPVQTPGAGPTPAPVGRGAGGGTGGIPSVSATDFKGGGAPIIGVGSNRSGEAMLVVNEQARYETWEFLYDPRIEQLYAKGSLLGGISSGLPTGGFGTPIAPPILTPPPHPSPP